MLDKIRGLLYKLGFKPKFGSVFYSPVLDHNQMIKEGWEIFDQTYRETREKILLEGETAGYTVKYEWHDETNSFMANEELRRWTEK